MAKRAHPNPQSGSSQTRRGDRALGWLQPLTRAWAQWRGAAAATAVPMMEEYEQRLMYSADLAAVSLALTPGVAAAPAVEQRVIDAHGEYAASDVVERARQTELVIVDAAVDDKNILLNQLHTIDGRRLEILTLEAGDDGVRQISEALQGRSDIAALHIFSHGADAELQLGSTTINAALLAARGGEIAAWGNALGAGGDILLYGCDVAAGTAGHLFVQQIARLTGADVASSTDTTGHAALRGDWELEYQIGTIEAHLALSQQAQDEWFGELATATLTAVKDTHIQSNAADRDNNFGASTTLILDKAGGGLGNGHPLLQFDLSAIPSDAIINSATLQMQATSITASTVLNVYQLTEAWNEGTGPNAGAPGAASWNDRITGTAWTDAGGLPNAAPVVATLTTSAAGAHTWNVTAIVQSWLNGSANNGLMLASTSTGSDIVTYSSREGATAPVLVVDYTPFLVDTTNDVLDGNTSTIAALLAGKGTDGRISLREAILAANNTPGTDTIRFGIAGVGVQTINVTAGLVITDRIIIDGTQNNGASANGGLPAIILDGGSRNTDGLTLADGADGSVIRGLVIRDFNGDGIEIAAGADGITVANNFIGNFRADGTRASATDSNTGAGIHVNSLFNTIGGTAVADRNVIGGNDGAGILMEIPDGRSTLGFNNLVQNNLIGTEIDGTTALANNVGIQLDNGAEWNRIRTNTIAHNTGSGIVIGGSGAAVHDALIGGGAGDQNIIAFNGGDGVTVVSGIHNSVVRNSIHSNTGLGIDLRNGAASTGVTANDTGDADSGGNELQNAPVLASVQTVSPTQVRVIGTLNAVANTEHLIEFFSNAAADASGSGEGQTYLGDVTVTTNGSGNASFNTLLTATLAPGTLVSATATNFYTLIFIPVRGSTSEFSNNVLLDNTAPVLDASRTPQLNNVPANAPLPVGAAGTLVSALVDFSTPAGQLDNVTDTDGGAQLGIAITGVDTVNGTLYYTTSGGTGWTAVGAVSDNNALLLAADGGTRLYYQTNAGASGTLASAVTFRAWDRTSGVTGSFTNASINGGASAFSAGSDTVSLTVTAVNSAPVNTVPGAQTVNEDTALNMAGISVNDVNSNLSSTQLTVNNGVLEVNLAGGAVIVAGANTSGNLTLGGTQAQINAALASLKYQGNLNFSGSDTLRVFSIDSDVTPLSDTDDIIITVNAVNDAPSSSGGAVSGSEDTPYVFTWANFNVSDVDTAIASGTGMRLDVLPVDGTLQYFNGSGWTPVALGQVVTKATIDAGSLRFVPLADESGYDGYAAAGVGNLRQDYARFSFTPVQTNALTIVNPNGAANVLAEGVGLNPATGWTTSGADAGVQNLVAADFPLDNDNALYVNAGATLTQTLAGTFSAARNYSLAFEFGWRNGAAYPTEPEFRVELWAGTTLLGSMDQTSVTGLQGEFVSGVLVMDGSLSGAVEGAALQIRLVGTDLQSNFDNLTLTSFARVGDIGTTAVMAVDIVPVEDAPTATNLNAAETYTEDTALNLINIVVSDVDSANVTATLRLSNVAAGSLSTATSGAVTSTYDSPTGVWTASGAIANVNALLAGVTFNPAANFNGSFTIATSVSDGVTAAITGNKAMTGTAVNDVPTAAITVPTYSATEQVNLTLSGTGISVADVDAGSAVVQVSLSIVSGTLIAAQGTTGVTIGSIGPTLTFSGNINQINNLLSGNLGSSLTYVFNADSPPVSDTLTLQINDLGNTGGAALTAQDTAVINITAVNDAPTATNLSAAESYTEDTALNLTNIVVSDVDSANVTVTLTLSNVAAGSLSTATSGAVTSTYVAGTGVWTASGAIADVNTLLAGVTFNPASNFNSNFSIATSVSDGVAAPVTGTKNVIGTAVNDAPTATNLNTAETYTEDTALNLTNIVVSDVDSANVTVTLTLSNVAAGSLSTATSGAVTSTYVAGTGVWTASGAIANVNTLLAGVTFNPASNFNSSFSIATSVSDAVAAPVTGIKNVTGTAVNDAPTATNLSAAESYTEDTALNLTNIVVSDVDSANVTVTLTLSNTAAGSLSTATSGAVISTYVAGTGMWTASGAVANVNTLLAGVTFNPASNFNSNFSIATSVSDGVAAPVTGVKTITGTPVNDAPTATNLNTAETYTEDTALNLTNIVVSDLDSASVTVTLTLSNTAAGSLSTATSGAVTSTYVAGTGVWTASGAIANVNTLLAGVTFNPASNFNSNFSITTSVSDGVAAPVTGVKTITGTAVNDAPTATNLSAAESYTEDTALNLNNIVVSDVDSANVTVTLTLSNTAAGSLSTATSGAVTSNYVAGTGVWTASGSIADVNTLLAGVTFNPAANFNSNFTIATSVSDGVAVPITGTKNVTASAVNDAPTATNLGAAETYTEDVALNLTDIAVGDVDSANVTVTLTLSNPAAGSLSTAASGAVISTYVAGTGVWTASGAIADVNTLLAGVTFNPAANFNSNFTIATSVSDGVAFPIAGIKNVTATAVNDVPTATNLSAPENYTEDVVQNLTDIVVGDVDSANVTVTLTLSNPAAGSLSTATSGAVTSTYSAGTGVWTASGAIADVNTLLAGVTFNPASDFNSNFTIATSVSDGVAAPITGIKNVTGTAVNDAPTATNLNAAETYTEDVALNLTNIVVGDVDSANVTVTLTLSNPAAGNLSTATSGTVTSTYVAGTGVWTASGAISDVNALLAGVTFNPTTNINSNFSITTSVSDGVAAPITGNKLLTGIAVNDAPTTSPVTMAAINEDSGARLITQAELLTSAFDVDSPSLVATGLTIASGSGNLVDNGNGTWRYTPALDDDSAVTFSYVVSDGSLTATGSASLDVTPVNDAPVISVPGAQTFAPNSAGAITGISVADVEGNLVLAQLRVGNGLLTVLSSGGVTVSGNSSANLVISGAQADINATLASLVYQVNTGFSGTDVLLVLAVDSDDATDSRTVNIAVTSLNQVPVIGGVAVGLLNEDAATPDLTTGAALTIVDPDSGESSFVAQTATLGTYGTFSVDAAGNWTYTAANNQAAIQQLAAGATITDSFTVVSVDGSASQTVVVTLTGVNDAAVIAGSAAGALLEDAAPTLITGGLLTISDADSGQSVFAAQNNVAGAYGVFNLDSSGNWSYAADNSNVLIQQLNTGATLTEQFVVASADGSASERIVIVITGIDDIQVLNNSGASLNEGGSVALSASQLQAASAGAAAAAFTYTVLTAPSVGSLVVGTQTLIAGGQFTQADINGGRVSYTHDGGETVADGFSFSVADASGAVAAPATFVLTINPVNDAPVAGNQSVTTFDNTPVVLRTGILGYADAEGTALSKIRVTALPGDGILQLGSSPVVVNQEISAADIAAGNLQFIPRAGLSAQTSATIGFQVSDGAAYSAASSSVSVLITPATLPVANPVTQPQPVVVATIPPPVPVSTPAAPQVIPAAPAVVATPAAITAPATPVDPLSPAAAPLLDSASAQNNGSRVSDLGEVTPLRNASLGQALLPGAITSMMLNSLVTQFNLEALKPLEASVSDRTASATSSNAFIGELDRLRDGVRAEEALERNIIVSSVATGASMSVGYVLWLLRGGLLMTSLLSSLPAWRFVDPLPVMGRLKEDDDEDDDVDDTVESIVRGGRSS